MTQAGMILGTAAYMSPEQARGKAVDKRADIWAFGAVLFEMLTGRRAFAGDDLAITLAAVVMNDPAWATLAPATPWGVQQLLRRCLVKDPRQRIRDMGDVRLALEHANDPAPAPAPAPDDRRRQLLVWASAAIAVVSLAVAAFAIWNRPTAVQKTAVRLTIPLPPGQELTSYPAITRDGQTVAYVTRQGTDDAQLYLRDLSSFEPRAVADSSGALQPFFSPDGKWVAFFAQGQLQKAEVSGGTPIRLAEALNPLGGTWNDDNTIIFAPSLGSGLLRIPASGGTPESLTKPDGAAKGYAHVAPASPSGRTKRPVHRLGTSAGNRGAVARFGPMGCRAAREPVRRRQVRGHERNQRSHPVRRSERRNHGGSVRRRAPRAHQRRCVGPHRRVLRR